MPAARASPVLLDATVLRCTVSRPGGAGLVVGLIAAHSCAEERLGPAALVALASRLAGWFEGASQIVMLPPPGGE